MYTPAGRRGTFLLVAMLLLLSVLLEQCLLLPLFPWISRLGGMRVMFVIFDIPVQLPVITWAPAGLIFLFFYGVVILPALRRHTSQSFHGGPTAGQALQKKLWVLFARWWMLPGWIAAGGGIFYLLKDYMPKGVRNGIDSFGVRADLVLPYPSEETVHLEGAMIIMIGFIIGWRMMVRSAMVQSPARVAVGTAAMEHDPAPPSAKQKLPVKQPVWLPEEEHRIVSRIPEPVQMKEGAAATATAATAGTAAITKTTPAVPASKSRPCAAVPMPYMGIRRGRNRPCVVEGEIKPAVFRGIDSRPVLQSAASTSTTS